jgi:Uma2 family endonuclease
VRSLRAAHRWTVDDYYRMGEVGLLDPDARTELLDGEIVDMPPTGPVHAGLIERLADLIEPRCAGQAQVRTQNPVRLSQHSEPVPDLALVRPRQDYYLGGHPMPADVLLLIEIADSTRRRDQRRKIPLYAAAGIPEVWLVDVRRSRIGVYRDPQHGRYGDPGHALRGATLTPRRLPALDVLADELLP